MRLLVLLLCLVSPFGWSANWTEDRIQYITYKAEKAARKDKWNKAIRLNKKALKGCLILYNERHPTCILIMKNASEAYFQSGKLLKHAEYISKAYQLASTNLGELNYHTGTVRNIYYQLLMEQEHYEEAIPVVQELISVEKAKDNDEFKILEWEIVLYALYLVTEQQQYEVPTLVRMLNLTEKLIGKESKDFQRVVTVLAEKYCSAQDLKNFTNLVSKYRLSLKCMP